MAGRVLRFANPDLFIALTDPKNARAYIANFDWGDLDAPKYVVWGVEEKIWFEKMTDDEAVIAALIILRDVEIPQAHRVSQMLDEHDC